MKRKIIALCLTMSIAMTCQMSFATDTGGKPARLNSVHITDLKTEEVTVKETLE